MKLDIPYYIRQVLREQRMVNIPGIGTFKLEQSSAIFNDDKSILSPPVLNITFDDTESNDDSLLRYILDTGLLSESKAKKKIDQYTQSAFNKLLNVNTFMIDGIGLVTRKEGEDKVQFEPSVQKLTREFSDLKPIALSPIARINGQVAAAVATTVKPEVKESGSFLPRILLLSLLLIALYFLGRYFYNNYFNDSNQNKVGLVEDGQQEDDATLNGAEMEDLEQKYEEIDVLIDPENIKTKTDESGNSKLNEELNNLEGEDTTLENGEMGGSNSKILNSSQSDENDGMDIDSDSTKAAVLDKTANKHADIIPESGECIIVVGSFIKSLNAIKMVSLLERKGYKVHQEQYKGFSRVGIKYECTDEDLEQYLQDVRKEISSKAWYLDPELEVPYIK